MQQIIKYLYESFQSKKLSIFGLFIGYILIIISCGLFNKAIDINFLKILSKLSVIHNYIDFLPTLIVIILCVLWTWHWFVLRKLPKFYDREIGILIAFSDIGTNKQYSKRINELLSEYISQNIATIITNIKVKQLPNHIIVISEQDANKIISQTNAKLIVWKSINPMRDNGKNIINFNHINYTTRINYKSIQNINFLLDTTSLFDAQKTSYTTNSEYTEGMEVFKNITLTANICIAKSLITVSYYKEAIQILEYIKPQLTKQEHVNFILKNIDYAYHCIAKDIYNKDIYVTGKFIINKKSLSDIIHCLDKINNKETNYYMLFRSVILFLQGNYIDAEQCMKTNLLSKNKIEQDSINISKAFILLYKGNLPAAFELLFTVNFISINNYDINHILDFYISIIELKQDKYHLLFGYAYINYKCMDIVVAKEYFNNFIDHPNNILDTWKKKAKHFIQKINKKSQKQLK